MGFVVAIDGPAASGKGVISGRLGTAFGLPVLDTGLLYRAVALALLGTGDDPASADAALRAARSLDFDDLEEPALRDRRAGEAASVVASHMGVRAALLDIQRRFAAREPGAILDGRDIGTVIAPGAQVKLYITAAAPVRAERRRRQWLERGEAVALGDILAEIRERDARDEGRLAAPLRRAPDAVLLDTTDLDIEGAFDAACRIVEAARDGGGV